MAKITIDSHFDDIKEFAELKRRITRVLEKLQTDINNSIPSLLTITSEETEVPKETPINTIIFKIRTDQTVRIGYFDGEDILITP